MDFVYDCLKIYTDTFNLMWSSPVLRYFLLVPLFVAMCGLALGIVHAAKPDSH